MRLFRPANREIHDTGGATRGTRNDAIIDVALVAHKDSASAVNLGVVPESADQP
jgi:hypothetical protein